MMANTAPLVLAARVAGKRKDRAALRTAARGWVDARRAEDIWWAGTKPLTMADFDALDAAMLMLVGEGRSTSASVTARRVVINTPADGPERRRPLAKVPEAELNNYGLRDLAWARVLGSTWEPVAPRHPRRGQLLGVGRKGDAVARKILTAFAARDRDQIVAAIRAAAKLEGSKRFSLFGFALAEESRRLGIDPGLAAYDF
jgi:hypothetical protein